METKRSGLFYYLGPGVFGLVVLGLAASASATAPGTGWYKLKTQFQGEGKCLEGNQFNPAAVLGGAAFMDNCQNVSGQLWKFVPEGASGFYRLKTQFQGESKCLEGNQNSSAAVLQGAAFMDNCQNVSGQLWKLVPIEGSNYYKLKTQFQGEGKCFEGNQYPNPGGQGSGTTSVQKGAAFMDTCQNVSGQSWALVAQSQTWTRQSDFPGFQSNGKGRYGAVAFSIGDRGYFGTGNDGVDRDDFHEFDPVTNKWSARDSFKGGPRQYAIGFAVNDKGYVGMGFGKKDLWQFDPKASPGSQWKQATDFPGIPRGNAVGFAVNGKGYFGTGSYPGNTLSDFWQYDAEKDPKLNASLPPTSQPWTQKADLGTTGKAGSPPAVKRSSAIGFGVGRFGYVGTGSDGSLRNYSGEFWRYDPEHNEWASVAPFMGGGMVWGTGYGTAARGYAFEPTSGRFYEYDPTANLWSQKPSPPVTKSMNSAVSFSIGETGYYGTGYDYSYRGDFWKYAS